VQGVSIFSVVCYLYLLCGDRYYSILFAQVTQGRASEMIQELYLVVPALCRDHGEGLKKQEAPGSFRELPGPLASFPEASVNLVAKFLGVSRKLPGRFRELLGASRTFWELPGPSRSFREAPLSFPDLLGASRTSWKLPGPPRSFPEASR
jgi:hypothetical protein